MTVDIATFKHESNLNRATYERLRDEIRQKHAGKYVALAKGQFVGSAETFDDACALVEKLKPVPEYYLVFRAEKEPDFELAYDLNG
jgi:hypothetical protein